MKVQAWGKFDKNDETGGVHPLAHHSMDVAAVFRQMIKLPIVRDRLETAACEPLADSQYERLAALVFLHDIGKLHPGFQAKRLSFEAWRGPRRGHLEEGWAFFMLAARQPEHPFHETMKQILDWGETAVEHLLAAIIAHHGRPVMACGNPTLSGDWDRPRPPGYDWRTEARIMDDMLHGWFERAFDEADAPLPVVNRFHHLVAGLVTLADWIGSNRQFFNFQAPFDPAYNTTACSRAEKALAAIHFDPGFLEFHTAPDFRTLTSFPVPNPAQAIVGNIGTEARLLILEAETGSGKTEAALWRFTQLLAAGKVSGLYFAVPTRAAARQLHDRVVMAMGRVFGQNGPEPVLAIPGQLRAGEHDGERLPDWKVRWDDNLDFVSRRWAAEHATRFLASMIAVGMIDQAMLAALKVKHAHLRGSALSRSLLVIDEVHASDAYMTEIQKHLLHGHLAVGGYAMLMSATLGSRARAEWTEGPFPDTETAASIPYPAIWVGEQSAPQVPKATGRSRTVHMKPVLTMDPVKAAECAISAAQASARVLVIRNTVASAMETWCAVRAIDGDSLLLRVGCGPALHHGRFAAEDRFLLDRAVEAALAPKDRPDSNGCIVVGTQTLEQSLDIDADFLITDLCPVDVLLQRIGRLHRHDTGAAARPAGFGIARACVLMPLDGLDHLAKPDYQNGLGAWEGPDGFNGIYLDLACLELTRRFILEHPVWRIPEMNRALVEGATHSQRIDALIAEKGEEWAKYDRKVGGSRLAERMVAELNVLDREMGFGELTFPDQDERILSRLGEDGMVLNFDPAPKGPFGTSISRLALPARWSRGVKDCDPTVENSGDGLVVSVGDRQFWYSRAGLVRYELPGS